MRHLLLVAILAVAVLLPASAQARQVSSTTGGITLSVASLEFQYPVEQESPNYFDNNCGGFPSNPACDSSTWVNNPTPCAWDVDDYIDITGNGSLTANVPSTGSLCTVADGYDNFSNDNHLINVLVTAGTPNLTVTLTNDQGYSETAVAVDAGRNWQYTICHRDLTGYPNPPNWYPVIPGSNGGTGLLVSYTLTVSSTKHVSGVSAVLQLGRRLYSICP